MPANSHDAHSQEESASPSPDFRTWRSVFRSWRDSAPSFKPANRLSLIIPSLKLVTDHPNIEEKDAKTAESLNELRWIARRIERTDHASGGLRATAHLRGLLPEVGSDESQEKDELTRNAHTGLDMINRAFTQSQDVIDPEHLLSQLTEMEWQATSYGSLLFTASEVGALAMAIKSAASGDLIGLELLGSCVAVAESFRYAVGYATAPSTAKNLTMVALGRVRKHVEGVESREPTSNDGSRDGDEPAPEGQNEG